jgi:zona occludens toxin
MSIVLVTGTPGAGKTLYAVKTLLEDLIPSGRRIYTNINGFQTDAKNVTICDDEMPYKWMDEDDDAIFVFDEVQHQYGTRNGAAKVPPYISAFETHRHHGFDFYLITQGPSLIDRHLWPLVERHVHMYRAFGLKRSSKFEWNAVNPSPNPAQTRTNAEKRNFSFPAKYFEHYKSASTHTVKSRFPVRLFAFLALLIVVILFCGWYLFRSVSPDRISDRAETLQEATLEGLEPGQALTLRTPCLARVVGRSGAGYVIRFVNGSVRSVSPRSIGTTPEGRGFLILQNRKFYLCNRI